MAKTTEDRARELEARIYAELARILKDNGVRFYSSLNNRGHSETFPKNPADDQLVELETSLYELMGLAADNTSIEFVYATSDTAEVLVEPTRLRWEHGAFNNRTGDIERLLEQRPRDLSDAIQKGLVEEGITIYGPEMTFFVPVSPEGMSARTFFNSFPRGRHSRFEMVRALNRSGATWLAFEPDDATRLTAVVPKSEIANLMEGPLVNLDAKVVQRDSAGHIGYVIDIGGVRSGQVEEATYTDFYTRKGRLRVFTTADEPKPGLQRPVFAELEFSAIDHNIDGEAIRSVTGTGERRVRQQIDRGPGTQQNFYRGH